MIKKGGGDVEYVLVNDSQINNCLEQEYPSRSTDRPRTDPKSTANGVGKNEKIKFSYD